jgi:hypothetical protein
MDIVTTGPASAPRLRAGRTLLLLLLVAAPLACGEHELEVPGQAFYPVAYNPYQQTSAERDSILTALSEIDQSAFLGAFQQLAHHDFTRYTRTEQFDREDYLIAFQEHIVRHEMRRGQRAYVTMAMDSAGAFDYGYFSRFVSENVTSQDPPDLTRHIVPEDPAYLSVRNRDAYIYRLLPDTLMWDMVARVIEVRAKPADGDGQNIRRVRLYVDRGSQQLIAMYMERIDLAMLFREESRFYVHTRPTPEGTWVPYNTRFESRISVPFRPTQLFRTVSTYFQYDATS